MCVSYYLETGLAPCFLRSAIWASPNPSYSTGRGALEVRLSRQFLPSSGEVWNSAKHLKPACRDFGRPSLFRCCTVFKTWSSACVHHPTIWSIENLDQSLEGFKRPYARASVVNILVCQWDKFNRGINAGSTLLVWACRAGSCSGSMPPEKKTKGSCQPGGIRGI